MIKEQRFYYSVAISISLDRRTQSKKLHIGGPIVNLLAANGVPCKECLVQVACLQERKMFKTNPNAGGKFGAQKYIETEFCKQLRNFLDDCGRPYNGLLDWDGR